MHRRTLVRHSFARTSAEGGGGGNPSAGDPPAGGGNPPAGDPPAAKPEAKDEAGVGLGFPSETKVDDMNADQKAAYWRNEAKKANKRVPSNLEQMQRDAQAWAEHQRAQLPEEQRKAAEREEQIRRDARAEAIREANRDNALALLRVTLTTRGKNAAEVDDIVDPLSAEKFLDAEGKVDAGKVTAYADKIAPSRSGGGGGTPGQGHHDGAPTDKFAEGRAEAARRGYGGLKKDTHKVGSPASTTSTV